MAKKCFFIAQKKRPDALNALQKISAFYKVRFLKNQEKPQKMTIFFSRFGLKWVFYEVFLGFFQKPYFVKLWGFLRCIQCIGTLLLSYQKHILAIISYFSL